MSIPFASFFAGIGGFDLGFERAGMQCVLQCELDANCRELLGKKFSALQLSDIRAIAAAHRRIRLNRPGIDHEKWNRLFALLRTAVVWCGGFPCQDVSVAGNRAGLAGERSGLWFAFRRLLALFRPAWAVIENVPGLLSSNGGLDFAVILSGLEELRYGVAWKTYDAQYLGVAQRRERVFIVASLASLRCAEVLFEPDSVCGDSAPSREPRERITGTFGARASAGGGLGTDFEIGGGCSRSLRASDGGVDREDGHTLIPAVVGALSDGAHNGGGATGKMPTPDASLPSVAWALQERDSKGSDSSTKEGHLIPIRRGGFFDVTPLDTTQITSPENRCNPKAGDPSHPLSRNAHPPAIAFSGRDRGDDGRGYECNAQVTGDISPALDTVKPPRVAIAFKAPNEIHPPLSADADKGDQDPLIFQTRIARNGRGQPSEGVRRLTPTECSRLQGFTDDWNSIFSDSVRYRQFGNAVCVPVAEWIGRRLVKAISKCSAKA